MPYIYSNYNPWVEAAAYGEALGNSLGQAITKLPAQRLQLAEEQQKFPLDLELMRAHIANLKATPELKQQMVEMRRQNDADKLQYLNADLERKRQYDADRTSWQGENLDLRRALLEIQQQRANTYQQNADTHLQSVNDKGGVTPSQMDKRVATGLTLAPQVAAAQVPGTKAEDVKATPDMLAAINAAAEQPGSIIANLMGMVKPNTVTNQPGMLRKWWTGSDAPVVTTNGVRWELPKLIAQLQQPATTNHAEVPVPSSRPVGFKVTTDKGTFIWNGQSWDEAPQQ